MAVCFSFSHFCCFLLVMALFRLCLSNSDLSDVLCRDEEREALVEFKQGLIDEADRLGSWDAGKKTDCCNWVGIVCDNSTGHVQKIHLPRNCYTDDFSTEKDSEECYKQRLGGNLSASLMHLKQLKHLDLSDNYFAGIQIPGFIGSLGNLRYLNLSGSGFGGTIPPQLGNLTKLHILCLGSFYHPFSEITSMRNMHWLSSLGGLRHLDMSGVDLSKATDWLQVINTLPSLVELHLSHTFLPNTHPHVSSLNLTSLSLLDLSHNYYFFNSSLPQWVFSINTLVSLDLSWCGIQYYSPSIDIFRNLTSLESLHVCGNDFMNSSLALKGLSSIGSNLVSLDIGRSGISSSVLRALHNLTSLLTLDLSDNELTETIPKSLANLCNLRHIHLEFNDFPNISLTSHLQSFFECKQPRLESLSLGYSGLSGHLPYEIGQLTYLVDLQLHNNLISGSIPDSIGGLSSLKSLDLQNNHFSGPIPDSIGGLSSLKSLDLQNNLFSGPIPDSIGGLSSLKSLDLSNNHISGPIPDSIGGLSSLKSLDLSNNHISGPIPDSIGGLSSLRSLYLQSNLISGPIPYSFGRLSSLERLDVSDNQLNGSLPDSLGQLSNLEFLDFSNNSLTGVVTKSHLVELARLKFLKGGGNKLTLRSHHLTNWIPSFQLSELNLNCWNLGPQFPSWLQVHTDLESLGISNARISSLVPGSFWRSFPKLKYLDMSHNHLQGILPAEMAASLVIFDVSSNDFGGQLPQLSNTSSAWILDLSNNSFTGSLRNLFCLNDGKELELLVLNLANNNLSGVIPECRLRFLLSDLNLANNNLSGRIPRSLGSLSLSLLSLNMCNNKLSGRLHVSMKHLKNLGILQLARNELEGRIPEWFGRELTSLTILNLRSNKFDGNITHLLCNLTTIQILDLADNNLSGNIPRCFNSFDVLTGKETNSPDALGLEYATAYSDKSVLILSSASLVIKGREDTYSTILGLVMILDLSGNNFSGHIPTEIMALTALQSLNLSRNQLTGRIPENIGYLGLLESLDLSLNSLSGELPVSLSSLNFLSCFNVSYNNLTGRVPSSTQLRGFTESSFLGNKLCGKPLTINCAIKVPDGDQEEDNNGPQRADWGLIICIVSGFIAGFWAVLIPLVVNTKWRIAYFNFLSELRYVVSDAIHKYWYAILH